jgi:hypothetical protein
MQPPTPPPSLIRQLEGDTVDNFAIFSFLAAASIAFFSYLTVGRWIEARTAERRARDRFALLRKLADQPAESAQHLLALVREDDARELQREARERDQAWLDELKSGVILIVVGICLSMFLTSLNTGRALWAIGFVPGGVGFVIVAFALISGRRLRREAKR